MTENTRREHSRREAIAVGTVTGLALAAGPTTASAETGDLTVPDHITATYPEDELRRYQPKLDARRESQQRLIQQYGWKAESDLYSHDAYYYWLRYTDQESVFESLFPLGTAGLLGLDAHLDDHEWFVTFVDPDTGQPEEFLYTAYHHYGALLAAEDANVTSDVTADSTHLNLHVVHPWHNYTHLPEGSGALAENLAGLENWLDARSSWADRDVCANSHTAAVMDPWELKSRGHMWADGTWDARLGALWLRFGVGEATQADDTLYETGDAED